MSPTLLKTRRFLLALIFLNLIFIGSAFTESYQTSVDQRSVDKLDVEVQRLDDRLTNHIQSDYKVFSDLHTVDQQLIAKLDTRMSVLEAMVTQNTRILWGMLTTIGLQLVALVVGLMKVDIKRKVSIPEDD